MYGNMRHRFFAGCFAVFMLVLVVSLTGCRHKPSNVLSESELVDLMVDMQLAEAYSEVTNGAHAIGEERWKNGAAVLKAHNVTAEQLDSTLSWYGRNIDDFNKLYDKVDKKLIAKRNKALGSDAKVEDKDDIWPYGKYMLFSPLSSSSSFAFSLPAPAVGKGESFELSMYMGQQKSPKLMLAVDYEDGTTDMTTRSYMREMLATIKLQSDTGKIIKRLYGVIRVPSRSDLPVRLDSISLHTYPYDSVFYSSIVNQYRLPRKKEKKEEVSVVAGERKGYKSLADSIRDLPISAPGSFEKAKRTEL